MPGGQDYPRPGPTAPLLKAAGKPHAGISLRSAGNLVPSTGTSVARHKVLVARLAPGEGTPFLTARRAEPQRGSGNFQVHGAALPLHRNGPAAPVGLTRATPWAARRRRG